MTISGEESIKNQIIIKILRQQIWSYIKNATLTIRAAKSYNLTFDFN